MELDIPSGQDHPGEVAGLYEEHGVMLGVLVTSKGANMDSDSSFTSSLPGSLGALGQISEYV